MTSPLSIFGLHQSCCMDESAVPREARIYIGILAIAPGPSRSTKSPRNMNSRAALCSNWLISRRILLSRGLKEE